MYPPRAHPTTLRPPLPATIPLPRLLDRHANSRRYCARCVRARTRRGTPPRVMRPGTSQSPRGARLRRRSTRTPPASGIPPSARGRAARSGRTPERRARTRSRGVASFFRHRLHRPPGNPRLFWKKKEEKTESLARVPSLGVVASGSAPAPLGRPKRRPVHLRAPSLDARLCATAPPAPPRTGAPPRLPELPRAVRTLLLPPARSRSRSILSSRSRAAARSAASAPRLDPPPLRLRATLRRELRLAPSLRLRLLRLEALRRARSLRRALASARARSASAFFFAAHAPAPRPPRLYVRPPAPYEPQPPEPSSPLPPPPRADAPPPPPRKTPDVRGDAAVATKRGNHRGATKTRRRRRRDTRTREEIRHVAKRRGRSGGRSGDGGGAVLVAAGRRRPSYPPRRPSFLAVLLPLLLVVPGRDPRAIARDVRPHDAPAAHRTSTYLESSATRSVSSANPSPRSGRSSRHIPPPPPPGPPPPPSSPAAAHCPRTTPAEWCEGDEERIRRPRTRRRPTTAACEDVRPHFCLPPPSPPSPPPPTRRDSSLLPIRARILLLLLLREALADALGDELGDGVVRAFLLLCRFRLRRSSAPASAAFGSLLRLLLGEALFALEAFTLLLPPLACAERSPCFASESASPVPSPGPSARGPTGGRRVFRPSRECTPA